MQDKFKSCSLVCQWRRGELVWSGYKSAEDIAWYWIRKKPNNFWSRYELGKGSTQEWEHTLSAVLLINFTFLKRI